MTINIIKKEESKDGSVKYGFQNKKKNLFEAVYFTYEGHRNQKPAIINTICLSSQSGCSLNCPFCATGVGGFYENLPSEQIVQQAELVQQDLAISGKSPATSYALMGMGEPLLNLNNVVKFYSDVKSKNSEIDPISLSTIGIPKNILKLSEIQDINYKMFVSIHSPYKEQRDYLIPYNRTHPLESVISSCRKYAEKKNERVEASYLLLKGVNDSIEHALSLAELLDTSSFDVQILLFNEISGINFQRPDYSAAKMFEDVMNNKGFTCSIQVSKGRDIKAGCGQLVKNNIIN